jgi:hypothetical protein
MTTILHLTLHRQFFAEIASGKKRTEYRKAEAYWRERLEDRNYDIVIFRNGHAPNAPKCGLNFLASVAAETDAMQNMRSASDVSLR